MSRRKLKYPPAQQERPREKAGRKPHKPRQNITKKTQVKRVDKKIEVHNNIKNTIPQLPRHYVRTTWCRSKIYRQTKDVLYGCLPALSCSRLGPASDRRSTGSSPHKLTPHYHHYSEKIARHTGFGFKANKISTIYSTLGQALHSPIQALRSPSVEGGRRPKTSIEPFLSKPRVKVCTALRCQPACL